MDDRNFSAEQMRRLAAQISERLIHQYGMNALDEALSVVAMLVELGREELVPVWLQASLQIARRRRDDAARAA